jgi:glycosyltransferase involved in cell wall biosynthesis
MISVCIATYNGGKYIKEQIDSILLQLGRKDEIIISDDSSTDDTLSIIKSYNDPRIKIFFNKSTHSPIFNFENAIRNAKGSYIFLADQDDIWLPNKINNTVDLLKQYDLVVSDCKVVDQNLNVLEESFFYKRNSGTGFCKNLFKNTYLGCCMAFRKEILCYILPFPKRIAMHDIWIGLSVELNGSSYFMHEPLILYRRHENNVSFGGWNSKFLFSHKIKYRMEMLFEVLIRYYKR